VSPLERAIAIAAEAHAGVANNWTIEALRAEGFSEAVLVALESVTKRGGESYENFVARAAADPIGRVVKRADLEDNSDLSRVPSPTEKDLARVEKYRRALAQLSR